MKDLLLRRGISVSNTTNAWHQKAYHSIPFKGLTPIPRTPTDVKPAEGIRWLPEVQIFGEMKNALVMPPSSTACYRLYIRPRAKFLSHIALMSDAGEKHRHGIVFQVEVLDREGKSQIKRTKLIGPTQIDRHRKWIKFELGLHSFANLEVQIILSASVPNGKDPTHASAIWGDPTVLFRMSSANLIDLGKTKLRTHGFFGAIKKLASTARGGASFLEPQTPLEEPDRRHGHAYLQSTATALQKFADSKDQGRRQIVFVSHDAGNAGAQRVLITLIEWLCDTKGVEPKIILRHGGPLVSEFYRLGPVLELDWISERTREKLVRFCGGSSSLIYVNTLVPGDVAEQLASLHIPIVTHAHELENAINRWCVKEQLEALVRLTNHFIAASPSVARNLENHHGVVPEKVTTVYEFIKCRKENGDAVDRTAIRRKKQLPEEGCIIFGCGTTDWRKGPDLFIEVADETKKLGLKDAHFFWIGNDTGELGKLEAKVRKLGLEDRVRFLGEVQDARSYFAAGDVFLLTSREDPFPLVCLEAADCGLPIVCFDKAGGMPDFVQNDAGYVVSLEDTKAMAENLVLLGVDREERVRRGTVARQRVRARHDISIGGEEISYVIDKFAVRPSKYLAV